MAKRRKLIPARKPRNRSRDDDSLLLRSAESLGRVIGALQRQLDEATKRLAHSNPGAKSTTSRARTTSPKKKTPKTVSRSRKTAKKR
jgi:hypothetical protein